MLNLSRLFRDTGYFPFTAGILRRHKVSAHHAGHAVILFYNYYYKHACIVESTIKKAWIALSLSTQESRLPVCNVEQMMCIVYLREKRCISVATNWLWQVFVLQAWQEHKYSYFSVASHLTYARSSSESQE